MIRINLLPHKTRRAQADTGSQLWLVVLLLFFVAEVGGLFVFHGVKRQELEEQQRKNTELDRQIKDAKAKASAHTQVKEELKKLREREDAIAKLQSARTGPAAAMLELARILTPGRGPTVDPDRLEQLRKENPLAVFNASWDARRLWLSSFVEENRTVRLEGRARDGEDVSELARRMNLSTYFYDVSLLPAKKEKDADTGLEIVSFQLEAKVKY